MVLCPRLPLVRIMLVSQIVNGMLLPFILIFMLVLINKEKLMGGPPQRPLVQRGGLDHHRGHDRADRLPGGHRHPRPGDDVTRRAFSVAIFARNGGAVLLVRHRRLGTWLPVGGEIEPGETPLEAAVRELREETGLSGTFPAGLGVDGTPPGLIGYEEHQAGSKGLHMNFAFVADVATPRAGLLRRVERGALGDAGRDGIDCPENVRQLVRVALAAPGPPG